MNVIQQLVLFAKGIAGEDVGEAVGIGGNEIDRSVCEVEGVLFDIVPPVYRSTSIVIQRAVEQLDGEIGSSRPKDVEGIGEIITQNGIEASEVVFGKTQLVPKAFKGFRV